MNRFNFILSIIATPFVFLFGKDSKLGKKQKFVFDGDLQNCIINCEVNITRNFLISYGDKKYDLNRRGQFWKLIATIYLIPVNTIFTKYSGPKSAKYLDVESEMVYFSDLSEDFISDFEAKISSIAKNNLDKFKWLGEIPNSIVIS